jgi:hypothetical protein
MNGSPGRPDDFGRNIKETTWGRERAFYRVRTVGAVEKEKKLYSAGWKST